MKKKLCKLVSVFLCFVVTASLLSACKKNDVTTVSENGQSENIVEEAKNDGEASKEADADAIGAFGENSELSEKSMQAYEDFLDNKEALYFDEFLDSYVNSDRYWENCYLDGEVRKNAAYTLSEFIQTLYESGQSMDGFEFFKSEIGYAYIDAGADGVPELVLNLSTINDIGSSYMFVIKYMNGKLQFINYTQYGYRTFADINVFGYMERGGSMSASSHMFEYSFIDADGFEHPDYSYSNYISAYGLYIPYENDALEYAEEEGICDWVEIEEYHLNNYYSEDEYGEYLKSGIWNYYEIDQNYNRKENNDSIYEEGNPYNEYWKRTGYTRYSEEEIEKIIEENRKQMGLSKEVIEAESVVFDYLDEERTKEVYDSWFGESDQAVILEEPSWEYYYDGNAEGGQTNLKLKQVGKFPNEIIDEDKWFEGLGLAIPDRLSFNSGEHHYELSGLDASGYKWYPYLMDIYDYSGEELLYSLDFSNYYKPDKYNINDSSFVEESIGFARIEDDVLYVSNFHNTYASSAEHNAYITAIDLNDFRVLWRTEPLTCNSHDFIVVKDAIICGYGFTNEDDFVYVLDKATGERMQEIKVKTGPEYFHLSDGIVYVRCYDTDYEFEIEY